MSEWVSVGGKWFPANEYHVNGNAQEGTDPVYKGPDRAALEDLKKEGKDAQGFKGSDYRRNPDLLRQARQNNYQGVDEYLEEMFGVKHDEVISSQEDLLKAKVAKHENPARKNSAVTTPSGGMDTSGNGNHMKGGLGDPMGVNTGQLNQRA